MLVEILPLFINMTSTSAGSEPLSWNHSKGTLEVGGVIIVEQCNSELFPKGGDREMLTTPMFTALVKSHINIRLVKIIIVTNLQILT